MSQTREGKGKRSWGLGRMLELAGPERGRLALASLALAGESGLMLLVPRGLGELMDAVGQPDGRARLDRALVVLLALVVSAGVLAFLREYLFSFAGERLLAGLRKRLIGGLLGQEIAFFDRERTGELLARLNADTALLQHVTFQLAMGLRGVLQALGSAAVLLWTSTYLSLGLFVALPLLLLMLAASSKAMRQVAQRTQDALAHSAELAEQSLTNIRTVRSFAREASMLERYAARVDQALVSARSLSRVSAVFQSSITFAISLIVIVLLWHGGVLVLEGALSLGKLTAFVLYALYFGFALADLSILWGAFSRALGASTRLFELLDREPGPVESGTLRLGRVTGEVRFEGVGFRYPARPEALVLDAIELALSPGRVVAVVGPSGSGKSTLAALLTRFYDPMAGHLTLDGVDFRTLEPRWLREQIGVVAQEPALFAGSVAENIRFGRPDATRSEIESAARAAHAHEFVMALDDGYETLCGERGVQLSGGQRQRIAIARAILKDPRILVLDEATSALDAESEHLVQRALERLMRGRSVLVIAHRLSTVRNADSVVVLESGRIVERGSPAVLIQRDGAYRRLVERQFAASEV